MRRRRDEKLVREPPAGKLQASVILPARNEEDLLPSALQALAEQRKLNGERLSHEKYEVILLVNNSIDRTREVARSFRRLYPSLQLHIVERNFDKSHAHIGHVRRLLMDEACRRVGDLGSAEGLVLSTDSDSRVAPNWICQNAEEIKRGAEAVGGRIVVLPYEQDGIDAETREIFRCDHLYRRLICWLEDRCDPEPHDPWPRHYQHFGASLAITPRAYLAGGRIPTRRYLEDVAFYDALIRRDIRIRHSNLVRVYTSARLNGRTRFGLSRQLNDWQGSRKRLRGFRVESAHFLEQLFQARRQLRQLWFEYRGIPHEPAWTPYKLSAQLGMTPSSVIENAQTARYFGLLLSNIQFYERFRGTWPDRVRLVRIEEAVKELRARFEADRRRDARAAQRGRSFALA